MDALRAFAKFVRDFLGQPEGDVVVLGDDNDVQTDRNALKIVVSKLGPSVRTGGGVVFDAEAELEIFTTSWRQRMTVDFYGDGAYDQAVRLAETSKGQRGSELQKELSLSIQFPRQASRITDLVNEWATPRYQVEFNILTTTTSTEPTLRLESIDVVVIT